MGWLGWSEYDALHTDVNSIMLAYRGHIERLKAIHGDPKKDGANRPWWVQAKAEKAAAARQDLHGTKWVGGGGKPLMLTPKAFDAMFGKGPRSTKKIVIKAR